MGLLILVCRSSVHHLFQVIVLIAFILLRFSSVQNEHLRITLNITKCLLLATVSWKLSRSNFTVNFLWHHSYVYIQYAYIISYATYYCIIILNYNCLHCVLILLLYCYYCVTVRLHNIYRKT